MPKEPESDDLDTQTWWLENGQITTSSIHPTRDFGLPTHPLATVRGSTPDLNALTFLSLLNPSNTPAPAHSSSNPPPHLNISPDSPSLDAIRDYVLLNGAALLHVAGRAKSYKEGVEIARDSLESGGALAAFEGFRDASQRAMGETATTDLREGDAKAKMSMEDDGGSAARNGFVQSWLKAKRDRTMASTAEKPT